MEWHPWLLRQEGEAIFVEIGIRCPEDDGLQMGVPLLPRNLRSDDGLSLSLWLRQNCAGLIRLVCP